MPKSQKNNLIVHCPKCGDLQTHIYGQITNPKQIAIFVLSVHNSAEHQKEPSNGQRI
jgi:uncharacterized Zn finger protein